MAQLASKQIRILETDWQRFRELADESRQPVTQLVRNILLDYLEERGLREEEGDE